VFVATTAEESGLLGSEAYVQRPLIPLGQTAAVLNLDVTNVRGATRDIGALGMDRSTLGPVFEAAARAESLAVQSQPDVRGSFFRSDHFPFARSGVPDEYKPTFRFDGMAQQVRVTVRAARAIANDPAMPSWLPSSEFQRPQP
jgi:Zn-dependent M28 family amino/carboxypeptidase